MTLPVEFQKIPPKCGACGEYGHLRLRCLQPLKKTVQETTDFPAFTGVITHAPAPVLEPEPALVPSSPKVAHSL